MIQSPFSNGGNPAVETIGGEARFSYIPPAAVSDATTAGVSAHPAEPTRSHTAGEIDGVPREITANIVNNIANLPTLNMALSIFFCLISSYIAAVIPVFYTRM